MYRFDVAPVYTCVCLSVCLSVRLSCWAVYAHVLWASFPDPNKFYLILKAHFDYFENRV